MKLGVTIDAFREKRIIPVIQQYIGIADEIIVAVSQKPWLGDFEADDTYEKALSTGVKVITKHWKIEEDQRNETMEYLRGCDYVMVSHADTFFTKEDLLKLKDMTLTDRNYACNTLTYWKDFDTVIEPDILLPGIVIKADSVFNDKINIVGQDFTPKILPITCHHVAWVKTDDEILSKISSYSHAGEIRKEWFEGVWKKWTRDMKDFGPTFPKDFKTVRNSPLPKEIRDMLI